MWFPPNIAHWNGPFMMRKHPTDEINWVATRNVDRHAGMHLVVRSDEPNAAGICYQSAAFQRYRASLTRGRVRTCCLLCDIVGFQPSTHTTDFSILFFGQVGTQANEAVQTILSMSEISVHVRLWRPLRGVESCLACIYIYEYIKETHPAVKSK
jgi:hypothetical protein